MSTGTFKRIFTRRGRKGNVIVETALVSIVFFTLLFGILDIGQFLFIHHALVQRARNSIRWGAINNIDDTAAIQNKILYNQSTTQKDAKGNAVAGYFGLTATDVTVTTTGKGTDNYQVQVTINSFPFKVFGIAGHGTYKGTPISMSVPVGLYN